MQRRAEKEGVNIYRSCVYQRFKKSSQNTKVYLVLEGKTEESSTSRIFIDKNSNIIKNNVLRIINMYL
jgi:hypothetical protein